MWFPCVQSYTEACTWKIEVSVDQLDLTAVASGTLVETTITSEASTSAITTSDPALATASDAPVNSLPTPSQQHQAVRTFHYFVAQATCAPNIGLAVGPLAVCVDERVTRRDLVVAYACEPELVGPLVRPSTACVPETLAFVEDLLATPFPHPAYTLVFLPE